LCLDQARLIAWQTGWRDCNDAAGSPYTHLIVGFQGTYTSCKDSCQTYTFSLDCSIPERKQVLCKNKAFGAQEARDQVQTWKNANPNLKVLLSIGGDGQNKCWNADDHNTESTCNKDNAGTLVNDVKKLVDQHGFDGVDINFEAEANDNNMQFLYEFTKQLRTAIGNEKIITHTPREVEEAKGTKYYDNLKNLKELIDFVIPQFYNGNSRKLNNVGFDSNVQTMLSGLQEKFDAKQIIFGMCNGDGCLRPEDSLSSTETAHSSAHARFHTLQQFIQKISKV
jgi:hypothetical protein